MPFDDAPSQAGALLSPDAAAALFDGAPHSYQEVRTEAESGAPRGFPLEVSLELEHRSRHERRASANVVGVLDGFDPVLRHAHRVRWPPRPHR